MPTTTQLILIIVGLVAAASFFAGYIVSTHVHIRLFLHTRIIQPTPAQPYNSNVRPSQIDMSKQLPTKGGQNGGH